MNRRACLTVILALAVSAVAAQDDSRRREAEIGLERPAESRDRFLLPSRMEDLQVRPESAAVDADAEIVDARGTPETITIDYAALENRVGSIRAASVFRGNRAQGDPLVTGEDVSLGSGEILAVQRDEPATITVLPDGARLATSSTVLYAMDRAGQARELSLVHRSDGLHLQGDRDVYRGELLVGILDREDPRVSEPLGANVTVQFISAPGSLDPANVDLERIGMPFQRVSVETASTDDPFRVKLVSQVDPNAPDAELKVNRPRLAISAPAMLQGFGVEEADVTVSTAGPQRFAGRAVVLDLDNGWLAERTLTLDANGTASTSIRSTGLGSGRLTLAAGIFQANEKIIRYMAPWRFLAATLLGSCLGATVLVYMLRRSGATSRLKSVVDWIVGVIVGIGATAMAYAGMRLPEWVPLPAELVGEVVPFALSFICAAAGTRLIHAIVPGSSTTGTAA